MGVKDKNKAGESAEEPSVPNGAYVQPIVWA